MMLSYHVLWIGLVALGLGPVPSSSCASTGPSVQEGGAAAAAAAAPGSLELSSGVVVDPTTKRVYVMTPKKQVQAVDLGGETVWEYAGSARPLALEGDLLVCQSEPSEATNELSLIVLDTRQAGGDPISTSSVPLPAGVIPRIDAGLGGTFSTRAALRGEAFVSWDFKARPMRGMPDAGDLGGQPPTGTQVKDGASGTVKLDLRSGRAESVAPADLPPMIFDRPPQAADPRQLLSIDGRHLLRTERVADDSVFEKHQWTIVDVATGQAVGQLRSHVARAPFVVLDETLLYETGPYALNKDGVLEETPRELRAVDLAAGKTAWRRPVRDTVYRGPTPP